ncbi:MAG: flagellar biosynthetic protein FliR [Cohnella sp.]|jgi:flagellar biosynthetic protein FliR|uniref:flagellar biosynthetic protein FliR n=1 Tax=Cohnella sp. TaxID=1883426 RepID=UPI000E3ADD19|nr:flagellar biosynthetic protein FliR [Cohnella sp.]REK67260.1 MAG: flagellar biosynthetic protein FliR [Cohnella sp.]
MEQIMQLFPAFLLVLCRISSFIVVAPVFSTRTVPGTFKIGLAFFIAVIVFLNVGFDDRVTADANYILAVMKEVLAGLLIGFVAYLFFTVVQTAGSFMDMQMGLGVANIVDPLTGMSAPLLGNLKFMLMILVFLNINGHHYLISAIMDSYRWLPLDNHFFQTVYGGSLTAFLSRTFADTFMLALQVSAPLVVAMFLTDVGLALLTRAAPQFHVFVIGIPVKIMIGLAVLILVMPGIGVVFQTLFDHMYDALEKLFVILQAGES